MMFHPQLGVLNYLLRRVGLPPSRWVYSTTTVIPTLVLVEIWHWTPLVMLIVLGGLASLPTEPYEAARSTAPTPGRCSATSRCRWSWPFIMVAADHAHHRCAEGVRHHLRDQQRRARHRVGDDQHLPLPAGLRSTTSATPRRWWWCSSPDHRRCRCCCCRCARRKRSGTNRCERHAVRAHAPRTQSALSASPSSCWSRPRSSSSSGCSRCRSRTRSTTSPIRRCSSRASRHSRTSSRCSRENRLRASTC